MEIQPTRQKVSIGGCYRVVHKNISLNYYSIKRVLDIYVKRQINEVKIITRKKE